MSYFSIILFLIGIIFSQSNMTPPSIPEIIAVGEDGSVTVTWSRIAESSIDGKTGYSDFEGYRLYKSTDGGLTWGDIETGIIPQNGEIVGWRPIQQFDLDEDEDEKRCIYSNSYDCEDDPLTSEDESLMREISIKGEDPVAPWFYLGEDTGLSHSFTDTDVINGIEYTYAITAYDMGVRIDSVGILITEDEVILDTAWNVTNPGHFYCPDGWGLDGLEEGKYSQCPSFESPKFSESFTDYNSNGTWDQGEPWDDENMDGIWNSVRENLINIVTVTPSNNATDISFPDDTNMENFIIANSNNSGTGTAIYRLVDEAGLEPAIIKLEIQADNNYDTDGGLSDNDGDFEDYNTRNPSLYIYRINEDESLYSGYYAEYTNNNDNAYLLDLPGSTLNDDSSLILVPTYLIEDHSLMFSNELSFDNNFTYWFYGVQFRFDNYWSELPQTNSYATFDTILYYNSENEFNQFLKSTFTPIQYGGFEAPSGDITLEFWNEGFGNRAMFDYKIEFHTTEYIDTAYRNFPNDDYCLNVSVGNSEWDGRDQVSFLPFKITNQTTGRQVRVWHTDEGIYDNEFPPSQELDGISQSDVPGYTDCIWQPDEYLSFAYDSLAYGEDLIDCDDDCHDDWIDDNYDICGDLWDEEIGPIDISEEDCIQYCIDDCSIDDHKTYQLKLKYDLALIRQKYGQGLVFDSESGYPYFDLFDFWEEDNDYEEGDRVEVLKLIEFNDEVISTGIVGIYEAKKDIVASSEIYPNFCNGICPPNTVYDIDGDNLNDNPWKQLYPWDDGDYVILSPDKWFNDGDSWKVDLSTLGKKETLTSEMLDSVIVIPNPYVVNSQYNEEIYGNRLIFDKLPKECTISIYTVKGELVDKLYHGDETNLDGSIPWDLKNKNGDIVHPGLYFYAVEASGAKKKIGKFVIIR